MDRIRLKEDARRDINGRVWYAAQPYMVLLMLDWGVSVLSSIASRANNDVIMYIFSVLTFIAGIVMYFIEFPINVGCARYYMRMIDNTFAVWTEVFSDLKYPKIYWEELKAYLAISVLTLLGLICFIIPGIYVILVYSQVKFVFAEHPEYKCSQAMSRSVNIMNGHIWELFCLYFSFLPWYLLVGITFGIANIYVYPYTNCAYARYYRSISILFDAENPEFSDVFSQPKKQKKAKRYDDLNPFEEEFKDYESSSNLDDGNDDDGIDYTSIE